MAAMIAVAAAILSLIVRNNPLSYVFDDTFISLRYSRNLAEGHGLVWNVSGEPTEGYTNFLLVTLIAVAARLFGADYLQLALLIGIAATLTTAVVIYMYMAWKLHSLPGLALVAVLLFFLSPDTVRNTLSGMETSLFTLLVCTSIFSTDVYLRKQRVWFLVLGMLAALLACLTRPEGLLLAGVEGAVLFFTMPSQDRSRLLAISLVFVLALMLYGIWKWTCFGYLLPNSFYVKVARADGYSLSMYGFNYFVSSWTLVLVLLWVAGFVLREPEKLDIIAVALVGLFTLFYSVANPLMGHYNRFMYPVSPLILVMAVIGIDAICNHTTRYQRFRFLIVLAFLGIIVLPMRPWLVRHEWRHNSRVTKANYYYIKLAESLAELSNPASVTVAWADAGIIPYISGVTFIDLVGLNDNHIARCQDAGCIIDYVFAMRPDLIFLPWVQMPDGTISWIEWGHGRIGDNYDTLYLDERFEDWVYLGNYESPEAFSYDISFFVLANSSHYDELGIVLAPHLSQQPLPQRDPPIARSAP